MKTIINVECMDQELVITNSPVIASGGVHENFIAFNFCEKWNGFGKTAVFYRNENERFYSVLGPDDVCEVPHEVTDYEGTMYFGVYGESGEVTRTSKILKYKISKGAMTTLLKPSEEPTPDIYQQLLSVYGQTNEAIARETAEREASMMAEESARNSAINTAILAEENARKQADATEKTERQAEIAVERARINQLTRMEEGSTTGDAELMDVRVDASGQTHESAGEAVRSQYVALNTKIDDNVGRLSSDIADIFLYEKLSDATYVKGKYINYAHGRESINADYEYTIIRVKELTKYKTAESIEHIAFYDSNKVYISGIVNSGNIIVTPKNATYMAVSFPIANESLQSIKELSKFVEYEEITWVNGYYRRQHDGMIITLNGFSYSNYIKVTPNTICKVFKNGLHISFYNEFLEYVGGTLNQVFKIPTDAIFMVVSVEIVDQSSFYVEHDIKSYDLKVGNTIRLIDAITMANNLNIPLHIYGGEWEVKESESVEGVYTSVDIIGIGNPKIFGNPTTVNDAFSTLNLRVQTSNKSITIEGLTIVCSNSRYCVHDEMGNNTEESLGYTHIYKNCRFVSGENTYRPVGVGVGNGGRLIFESCIFESTATEKPQYLLDIHSGWNGQTKGTDATVKDCIFVGGSCSFTEVGTGENFKNICVATNNLVNSEPALITTNGKQIVFYSYNNKIVE